MVAFVPEDGTGLPLANSLVNVADADDILSTNTHSLWPTYDTTMKQKLLMWSTRLLNERVRWKGKKRFPTAGLPFPRDNLKDEDHEFFPNDAVPLPAKVATAVLADYLALNDPTTVNTQSNLKHITVDVINLSWDTNRAPHLWPASIGPILRDIGFVMMGSGGGKLIVKH